MTISDVMKRTGLSRKAIYLYEDRGLLSPDKISRGIFRCREYSESDIERLITISRLRALDVPIDEICHIFNSDCRIDIVLQEHLVRKKSRLSELTHSVRNIEALLKKLPPNSHVQDFDIAADGILPRRAQGPQVQQDYSANFTRRIAMQLYEAFLDRPLDTVERMDAWYQILAGLEAALTPEFLEAFDGYYCAMTAEQVYEDYRLRHRLVNGYPHYGKTESAAKAREIYTELFRLTRDPAALERWMAYEQNFMRPVLGVDAFPLECILVLSSVYPKYRASFEHVVNTYLLPLFRTEEGQILRGKLEGLLPKPSYPIMDYLIFFDFYNNTIRQVLYGQD